MFKRAKARDGLSARRRLTRVVAAATSICVVGLGAAGATAGAASASDSALDPALLSPFPTCPDRPASAPFAPWGDDNSYSPIEGGSFEDGGTGWTLAGATIAPENEVFHVNGPDDAQSLSLAGDARATAPDTCVDLGEHSIRMFVKSSGDPDSTLHIEATVEDPFTGLVVSFGYDVRGGPDTRGWSPTDQLLIPNLLGGLLDTGRLSLEFTTSGSATWNVDDVYLDPFKSH